MKAPATHAYMMCGPFITAIITGIVRKGPTPTMLMMLVAVAGTSPIPRSSRAGAEGATVSLVGP